MAIKYRWLSSRLKEMIANYMEMGINKLPTEAELAARYKVSRQTVRLALSLLEQDGLIKKRRGSGSYITGLTSDSARNTIGILISDASDYIYPGLLNDIQNTLSGSGYSSEVFVTNNRTCTEREILLKLLAEPPRGIIAEGCKSALPNPNIDLWNRLEEQQCAILFLHNHYPSLADSLYMKDDNIAGSALLVQHLLKQGHTDIGAIFKSDDLQGPERYLGFMEAMQKQHLTVPDEQISWFTSDHLNRLKAEKDTSFLKKTVQEVLDSCTAVICHNDMIAYYLVGELKSAGYQLPSDMAVTAFHNTYYSNSRVLSITSLSHKPHETGTKAAQMIIDKLKGLPVIHQELPWELHPKESTTERIKSS